MLIQYAGTCPGYTCCETKLGDDKSNTYYHSPAWEKEKLKRPASDKNAINLEIYN